MATIYHFPPRKYSRIHCGLWLAEHKTVHSYQSINWKQAHCSAKAALYGQTGREAGWRSAWTLNWQERGFYEVLYCAFYWYVGGVGMVGGCRALATLSLIRTKTNYQHLNMGCQYKFYWKMYSKQQYLWSWVHTCSSNLVNSNLKPEWKDNLISVNDLSCWWHFMPTK